MRSALLSVFVLPVALLAGACSSVYDDLPTTPDPVTVTDTFTGTITVNGAATHPFATAATGSVVATITSLGDNPPAKVGFLLGTYSGTTCTLATGALFNDNAVVTTVITGTVSTLNGSLCVRIYDVGAMTEPVPYTITVAHP
jgi:hypothetical protein